MFYALYILLAIVLVLVSIKLADYVDLLDKKTKLSGALIGGILLAAVTSLPELFTSITAVTVVKQPSMVLGNILGSNLFNISALGVILVLFIKKYRTVRVARFHVATVAAILIEFALIAVGMFCDEPKMGWISIISPFIAVVYALFIWRMPKASENDGADDNPLTVGQVVFRFCIAAVILIGASIAITYVSDIVSDKLNLGKTFAGALLLGLTTSLPEVVSTISLCSKRNFNAAFGNILGSDMFNFVILVVADIISFSKGATDIYVWDNQSFYLLIFGAIAAVLMLAAIAVKAFVKKRVESAPSATAQDGNASDPEAAGTEVSVTETAGGKTPAPEAEGVKDGTALTVLHIALNALAGICYILFIAFSFI